MTNSQIIEMLEKELTEIENYIEKMEARVNSNLSYKGRAHDKNRIIIMGWSVDRCKQKIEAIRYLHADTVWPDNTSAVGISHDDSLTAIVYAPAVIGGGVEVHRATVVYYMGTITMIDGEMKQRESNYLGKVSTIECLCGSAKRNSSVGILSNQNEKITCAKCLKLEVTKN